MTSLITSSRTALPRLSGRDVLLVLLAAAGATVLLGLSGLALAVTLVGRQYALVLTLLGGAVGIWAGLWLMLNRRHGWGWREMGFVRPRRSAWHLLWQVPLCVLASAVGAATLGTALGLSPSGGSSLEQGALDLPFGVALVALLVVCSVLVVPAAEEVLFRRVLLDWALTRMSTWAAVLLTSFAFAAVHVAPAAMVYVVFLGLFTSLLRLRYDSLWAPLALHAINNGLLAVIAVRALTG